MLQIDVLPARHGDSLWLEYGDASAPTRILVDGGPAFAYPSLRARFAALAPDQRYLDLLVVTHVDGDHVEGVIRLLRDEALGVEVREIWFNSLGHLPAAPGPTATMVYGPVQGEYLSALIKQRGIAWNLPFGGGAVKAGATVGLPGGARAILLSPTAQELARLRTAWSAELARAGIQPDASEEEMSRLKAITRLKPPLSYAGVNGGPDIEALAKRTFTQDDALANGSSIAMLFDYQGVRLLLLGDAFPEVVQQGVAALLEHEGGTRLKADLVKLPHHGSSGNINPALLDMLDCERYVVSSDGKYFRHPDPEAMARVIHHASRPLNLMFNYRSAYTNPWDDPRLKLEYDYQASYPVAGGAGLSLRLLD